MKKFLYAVLFCLPLWSCNVRESMEQAKIAERQTQKFYSVVGRDRDSVLNLFDDRIFQKNSREDLKEVFRQINEKQGAVVKYDLVKTSRGVSVGTGKQKVSYLRLQYKTKYNSGFTADERFEFFTDDKTIDQIDGWEFYEWGTGPAN